jgi:hypothetical protein
MPETTTMADDEDPFAELDRSIMNIRDELEKSPPPPNKADLEATFDDLIFKKAQLVGGMVTDAVRRVAAAAAELEKVVKSARTDPLQMFQDKLAAAKQRIEQA